MRGQGRGRRGSVEASGKWHVAGSREGETREEVGNLDPGMNDPLPLGARGVPLSSPPSATLVRPFHPLFQPTRRRLRRDPFLSLSFHPFLLGSPPTPTSVPRPLTIVIPCRPPSPLPSPLEAVPFLFRILIAAHPLSHTSTLDALSLSTQTYHGEDDPSCQPSHSLAAFRDSFLPRPSMGASKRTIGRPG